jgi:GntR family transcriptional regulator
MEIDKPTNTAAIEFRLDPASGVPPYMQIVRQVENALRLGYLTVGDQLPRVKDVVATLAINPNTVLKAYKELELKGLAVGRPGQGTFVESATSVVPLADRAALQRKMARWLNDAFAAGLDEESVIGLFSMTLHEVSVAQAKEVS